MVTNWNSIACNPCLTIGRLFLSLFRPIGSNCFKSRYISTADYIPQSIAFVITPATIDRGNIDLTFVWGSLLLDIMCRETVSGIRTTHPSAGSQICVCSYKRSMVEKKMWMKDPTWIEMGGSRNLRNSERNSWSLVVANICSQWLKSRHYESNHVLVIRIRLELFRTKRIHI